VNTKETPMRFMLLAKGDKRYEAGLPPEPELMEKMGRFMEEESKRGVLVMAGGLAPSMLSKRIKNEAGVITVMDGPFAEAKEVIGGFAIVDVASMAEAIECSKRFWRVNGDGEGEIRPMF